MIQDNSLRRGVDLLSSPKLTIGCLLLITVYSGISGWFPWVIDKKVTPPAWAVATGLDHPFSTIPFLILIMVLFLNSLSCTIKRAGRTLRLLRGFLPEKALHLVIKDETGFFKFLKEQGFKERRGLYFKNRLGLLKALPLHIGIVTLIGGIFMEQSLHESGAFEIAPDEIIRLNEPGGVFDRFKGYLAPETPPDLQIALQYFDPFHHQKGYAPDRFSRIMVRTSDGKERVFSLDRSSGIKIGDVKIYQAIPYGLSLYIDIQDMGTRVFHLRDEGDRRSTGEFISPAGNRVIFYAETERPLTDPNGTGAIRIFLVDEKQKAEIYPGGSFRFGDRTARLITVNYWSGFTYSRSPGIFIVFTGIGIVVAGSLLLMIPAGIVKKEGSEWLLYVTGLREEFESELGQLCIIKKG